MKTASITMSNGEEMLVTAPEDKEMVFDPGLLQHGVLALGEYGPSGTKIAAFKEWTMATFGADGYTVAVNNPF